MRNYHKFHWSMHKDKIVIIILWQIKYYVYPPESANIILLAKLFPCVWLGVLDHTWLSHFEVNKVCLCIMFLVYFCIALSYSSHWHMGWQDPRQTIQLVKCTDWSGSHPGRFELSQTTIIGVNYHNKSFTLCVSVCGSCFTVVHVLYCTSVYLRAFLRVQGAHEYKSCACSAQLSNHHLWKVTSFERAYPLANYHNGR